MNRIVIALLLLAAGPAAFSQNRITPKEIELNNKNLKSDSLLVGSDADFKTAADGKNLSTESAVILCEKTTFDFDKKGTSVGKRIGRNIWGLVFAPVTLGASIMAANMTTEAHMLVEETERKEVLLKDKFAIENYSLLYFRQATDGDAFVARVIKKDGSTIPVDLEDAVHIEDPRSVPGAFRSYTEPKITSFYQPTYFKIAVPDLEEGDIIEYEYRHFNSKNYTNNPQYKEFDPVYYLCNREMPVVRQIIEVTTEDDNYFVTYKSMKGAPAFAERTVSGKKVYRWEDDNREKLKDVRYVDDFREYPSIKFQVVYARNRSHELVWFKSDADMQNDIPADELAEKAKAFWFESGKVQNTGDYAAGLSEGIEATVNDIYKGMKKRNTTDEPDDEYVRKAYYCIRASTLYNNWSDYAFAKVFSGLLGRKHLDHDILVTTYNGICDMDKVAFSQELAWVVRYKGKYYANPDEHGNPEDLPVYLTGNASVSFNYKIAKEKPQTEVLPLSDTSDNMLYTKVEASLDMQGLENISVEKTVQAKGLVKDGMTDGALAMTPFMETDFRNYDGTGMYEGLTPQQSQKAIGDFSQQKKDWKEDKPKMMKEAAESEYNATVEKYNDFKIIDDGRSFKKRTLKYTESFVLGGLTATAGDDILLSLPALIGSQARITRDERVRTLPIDLRYSRTQLYTITCAVPAGYTVKGLKNLTRRVDNECGSFTSTAAVKDGILVIDVRKLYKVKNMGAAQWPGLCTLLDAVYAFSQSKVVLQKD
jgi:hypothetical protein